MGTEKQRKLIIESLQNTFMNAKQNQICSEERINRQKLISELCLRYGVTKQKADEYIQVLIDAKFIKETRALDGDWGLWIAEQKIGENMFLLPDIQKDLNDGLNGN